MPVHLYGQPADMDAILEIARSRGIPVIEDAAQAHGAEYRGRRCGSMGLAAGFSFYPGKNLGAYGEGGLITTSNAELDRRCRMLRDWGQEKKYHHDIRGFNARLEGIQGAILRVKLRHLEDWTEARRRLADEYLRLLSDCDRIGLPQLYEDRRHVFHVFVVRVPDRVGFMKYLLDRGVHTAIHYPIPVHLLKGYSDLGYAKGDFPVAEQIADEVVSLPMFPELTPEQVATVAEVVQEWSRS
jgi:dTDP-4-amino-4,6-dideoxygalactose transaminase